MKTILLFTVLVSVSIFPSVCANIDAKWSAIEQVIGNCRIAQNGLLTLVATESALSTYKHSDHSLCAIITGLHVAKLPALVVAAITEQDLSLMGEVSDIVALFGLSGFWAGLLAGEENVYDYAYALGIVLNNIVITHMFNALNHAIKRHYPAATDEIKRRVLRSTVVSVGNLLVPTLFYLAGCADYIDFNAGRMWDMMMLLFLANTVSHVVAEVTGYVVAKYLLDGEFPATDGGVV